MFFEVFDMKELAMSVKKFDRICEEELYDWFVDLQEEFFYHYFNYTVDEESATELCAMILSMVRKAVPFKSGVAIKSKIFRNFFFLLIGLLRF